MAAVLPKKVAMFKFLLIVQTLVAASLVGVILMQRSEGPRRTVRHSVDRPGSHRRNGAAADPGGHVAGESSCPDFAVADTAGAGSAAAAAASSTGSE
jgi:hypothetical protein